MEALLKIENLSVGIQSPAGKVQAVRDVSLELHPGEILAIVGESGCGKSILCKTIMKLLPKSAKIEGGKIIANGVDITGYSDRDMRRLRGKLFSMIFQDPMTALNPTIPIGKQIAEAILVHEPKLPKEEVYNRVITLMELAGMTGGAVVRSAEELLAIDMGVTPTQHDAALPVSLLLMALMMADIIIRQTKIRRLREWMKKRFERKES